MYLAVDCSTTGAKAVIFDQDGRSVAAAHRPLDLARPEPGWHEQDPARWWAATKEAIREAVASLPDPGLVRGLSLTHQRESFALVDAGGGALRPAILWLDSRAGVEIAEFGTPSAVRLSGKPADVTVALYKLAWLRRHEPDRLAAAHRVVDVHAYLAWHLTGEWVSADGSADSLGLFDVRTRDWSDELLAIAGVRRDQLPKVRPTGSLVGHLRDAVAVELGLPAPIPLVAGLGDGQAAGLGAGVLDASTPYVNLGTSMVCGVPTATYTWHPAFRTLVGATPGSFVLESVLNSAAYMADWFRERFTGSRAPDPQLEAAAAALPPGALGLLTLPYWNTAQSPYWDPAARGAMVGWTGSHGREHAYRSILESVGYELRLHLSELQEATGVEVTGLRAMGGGSRSPLWSQLIADITGRDVTICAEPEMSAKGAGVLAAAYVGAEPVEVLARRWADAVDERVVTARAVDYAKFFDIYRRLYPQLREVFVDLAAAVSGRTTS